MGIRDAFSFVNISKIKPSLHSLSLKKKERRKKNALSERLKPVPSTEPINPPDHKKKKERRLNSATKFGNDQRVASSIRFNAFNIKCAGQIGPSSRRR